LHRVDMSSVDYSKFDAIIDSDEEDNFNRPDPVQGEVQAPSSTAISDVPLVYAPPPEPVAQRTPEESGMTKVDPDKLDPEMAKKLGLKQVGTMDDMKKMRKAFTHNGHTVYEWEQNLTEIHIYVQPPPGIRANMFDCKMTAEHVTLGIKGSQDKYFNHDFSYKIVEDESFWTMEDGELHFTLLKMAKGETWPSVFKGHEQLDAFSMQEVQKSIMKERFQEENPGFDFSNADFSGSCPDPRTFMGGVSYK